jgi:hypothetical protein
MSLVSALFWGASTLLICLLPRAMPQYGAGFLDGFSSIYPGFHGARSLADALLGTGYAIVDGGVGGFLLAWLYNTFAHM